MIVCITPELAIQVSDRYGPLTIVVRLFDRLFLSRLSWQFRWVTGMVRWQLSSVCLTGCFYHTWVGNSSEWQVWSVDNCRPSVWQAVSITPELAIQVSDRYGPLTIVVRLFDRLFLSHLSWQFKWVTGMVHWQLSFVCLTDCFYHTWVGDSSEWQVWSVDNCRPSVGQTVSISPELAIEVSDRYGPLTTVVRLFDRLFLSHLSWQLKWVTGMVRWQLSSVCLTGCFYNTWVGNSGEWQVWSVDNCRPSVWQTPLNVCANEVVFLFYWDAPRTASPAKQWFLLTYRLGASATHWLHQILQKHAKHIFANLFFKVHLFVYLTRFLAHLSRRLKWAIVIAHRPSSVVRPSVVRP